MAKTVNLVVLMGNLGANASSAEVNGDTVAEFRMATEHSSRQQDGSYKRAVNWHTVKVWGAKNVGKYLTKGTKVHVQGALGERAWEKDGETRYATEVAATARGLTLLGGPGRADPDDDDGPAGDY